MKTYLFYFILSITFYVLSFFLTAFYGVVIAETAFFEILNHILSVYFDSLYDLFAYKNLRYVTLIFVVITIFSNILCYNKQNKFTISLLFLCNTVIWGMPCFMFVHFFILLITGSFWF